VDTNTNKMNCGGCGIPCTGSQMCVSGQCKAMGDGGRQN
jgi:hypothetical protein